MRRPLADEELDTLVTLSSGASAVLGTFDDGLVYGLAAILQSPNFLFRIELGEDDPESGERRFSDYEMASRLSFFLWNTIPDETLMIAAEQGELTQEGIVGPGGPDDGGSSLRGRIAGIFFRYVDAP